MTGAHSKKRRGQPEVRCPLPSRLSSPSHVGNGFLQPPVNKNINSTDNVRAISVRLFLSHQYATRVRGQQLWLETRSVQVYVCDPVTRTTAFPAVPEQKGLRRACFSTACFFFFMYFFLLFSPGFRKMTRSGEGGGKQETMTCVLAVGLINRGRGEKESACRNWTTRHRYVTADADDIWREKDCTATPRRYSQFLGTSVLPKP